MPAPHWEFIWRITNGHRYPAKVFIEIDGTVTGEPKEHSKDRAAGVTLKPEEINMPLDELAERYPAPEKESA